MTPQFLRSEAARFREMAEGVTDREASRQRLLNMAIDYESRAAAADEVRSSEPVLVADPVPVAEPVLDSGPAVDVVVKPRAGRKSILRI
jgi:hypothetical protein